MIEIRDLSVRYGAVEAIRGVSLRARPGQTTVILGANGAGKSSILRAISGIAPVHHGSIHMDGRDLARIPAEKRAGLGLAHAMEGRRLFRQLSVRENLELAWSFGRRARPQAAAIAEIFDRFPILGEKAGIAAGLLSGGQQQMVILSCATIKNPDNLLLDEPSLGLAPIIVTQIYGFIADFARDTGACVIIAEQMATMALKVADHGCVLRSGRIVIEGSRAELQRNGVSRTLSASYL